MRFERQKDHKRDEKLEELLKEVNGLLGPVEAGVTASFEKNRHPVVFIMGSPRSGTTLFTQWLAGLGHFAYPTNLLSRFYGAPYIGAKIQLILTKHDFNKEIFDFNETIPFTSRLGKTKGALAPNEFWYFWRRFFPYGEIQRLNEDELEKIDARGFVAELAAIEAAFGKPFALKGMIANWNIPFLAGILEKALFVYIKRAPFYNVQSLLKSRLDYYGDTKAWYSFKPPEYSFLKDMNPYEQVAGQIHYTNRAVEEGLSKVDAPRKLEVGYEDFCRAPEKVFDDIVEKFRQQGCEFDWKYTGPPAFTDTNKVNMPGNDADEVVKAYKKISGEEIGL